MKPRVWAPNARAVALRVHARSLPMEADGGGWWNAVEDLEAGSAYQFVLDGGDSLPDPRSPSQPQGVFGPSEVVDHGAFPWRDTGWQAPPLASGVVYELHVGTFSAGGTFESAIPHLDHLAALGVTHVEIMPVSEFAGSRGWGYDGVLLWAPHHAYGGPNGMKRFVDACHARGLAVLLDVVYNHFGPEGSVVQRFGPYTTDQYHTAWGDAVNLDQPGSDAVRRFFCDNAMMWLRDYHCDGLRLDAVHAFHDLSAVHFLEQLAVETEALSAHLGRTLTLVAESNLNDPRIVRARDAGGYGIAAQWNDDFHHAVHVTLTGEQRGYYGDFAPFRDLARALQRGFVYEGQYSRFRNRSHGRPALLSAHQLVGFLQNHDQIGNRADGSRLGHVVSPARCYIAAALLLVAPCVPLLFQGEEWGASTPFPYFCHHQDPELARAVREGRQKEFPDLAAAADAIPDPESPDTFAAARLCWEESATGEHAALLAWYRRLIALRRSHPDLTDSRLDRCRVRYDERAGWISVQRGAIRLICNLGTQAQRVEVAPHGAFLADAGHIVLSDGQVVLGPDSVVILQA